MAAFFLSASACAADEPPCAQYGNYLMGTLVEGWFCADSPELARRAAEVYGERLAEYDDLFTVHRDSPLTRVNEGAGGWVDLDCRAADLIADARELARQTDGVFDPTIGALTALWKIGFGGTTAPGEEDIARARERVNWREIQVRHPAGSDRCQVMIGAGQQLDLGAIAKGWIGTAAAREMSSLGVRQGIINLGGNVVTLGRAPGGRRWRVGIQDPRTDRGQALAAISAEDTSVITSGDYERAIETADGQVYGHILSPATGHPAPPSFASVTIVDSDGARADGWCTAFFAMPRERALALAAERDGLKAFFLSADCREGWVTPALSDDFELIDQSVRLHRLGADQTGGSGPRRPPGEQK